jgi:aryl-alcohol dehydrogenase-like predicted oxidoreductase
LKASGLALAGLLGQSAVGAAAIDPKEEERRKAARPAMPLRNLGKTGHRVSLFGLGGQSALERPNNEAVAVPIVERALDLGVNYIDTSSIYGGPNRWSERYIGQVMKRRRSEAFLASKTKERTRDGSMRMIEESFKLLNTDQLDLWQLHDVGTMHDVDEICAKGGAMEALLQAKEQKLVRFIGVIGHHRPEAIMEMLRRFSFDATLIALNAADTYHHSFMSELLPMAVEKQLGIIAMKVVSRGRLLESWTPPPMERQKNSWEATGTYATRQGTLSLREALYYAFNLPISTAIVGIDTIAQLEENVRHASEFTPLSEKQMLEISGKAGLVAEQSLFFRYMQRA